VKQISVNFSDHQLTEVTGDEDATRWELKKNAFDHLVERALVRIVSARNRQDQLKSTRALLDIKLRRMQQGNWGLEGMLKTGEKGGKSVKFLLWGALLKIIEVGPEKDTPVEANNREAILHFEHQSALEQSDFETPFQEAAISYPLGEEGVLVASMQISRRPNGACTLKPSPKHEKGITMNLDDKLMHSFMKMLIDSSKRAEWDLELRLPASDSTTSTEVPLPDEVMHH